MKRLSLVLILGICLISLVSSSIYEDCEVYGTCQDARIITNIGNLSLNITNNLSPDGNASSICSGDEVLLGNGTCATSSNFGTGGGGGAMDFTNLALTNQSNNFGSFDQNTTGFWNGLFNWTVISNFFTFDGNTLFGNDTLLNNTFVNTGGDEIVNLNVTNDLAVTNKIKGTEGDSYMKIDNRGITMTADGSIFLDGNITFSNGTFISSGVINSNGSINPVTTNIFNLGTNDLRWKSIDVGQANIHSFINQTDGSAINIFEGNIELRNDLNVTGDADFNNAQFNDGWQEGGVSIIGGDGFFQTVYTVNITALGVSNMNVNGTITPGFDNQFDLGTFDKRFKDIYIADDVIANGSLQVDGNSYILGNLGLGTVSPGALLDVAGLTSPRIRITNTKSGSWTIGEELGALEFYGSDPSGPGPNVVGEIGMEVINTYGDDFDMTFAVADSSGSMTELMRIKQSGNVGIGVLNPSHLLTVAGYLNTTSIRSNNYYASDGSQGGTETCDGDDVFFFEDGLFIGC